MRPTHCTTANYSIRHGPTGPRGVYLSTEPVFRRLAGKPDCTHPLFPLCWAASGKGKEVSGSRGTRGQVGSGKKTEGGARPMVCTRMLTPAGSSNVVLDNASYSISNAVILAKSLVYFSSNCCTGAFGIALMPLRCLQCEKKCRQTHRPSTITLAAHARRGLITGQRRIQGT